MNKLPTLVFIAGIGHSGSTLLTLLLSAHSQVTTIGEVKALSPQNRRPLATFLARPCTCGRPDKNSCPFWQRFDELLRADYQLSLATLDVRSSDPALFRRHNQAVFQTIQKLTGRSIIVDASKDLDRLQQFLADGSFDLRVILLERQAHGVVYSEIKKGRPWLQFAAEGSGQIRRIRQALAGRAYRHVRYETLADAPRETIDGLMDWLGLTFEEGQLAWAEQEVHIIAGNRMRFSRDSTIRLDDAWRRQLTWRQKLIISWMSSTWFSRTMWLRHFFRLVPRRWREPS